MDITEYQSVDSSYKEMQNISSPRIITRDSHNLSRSLIDPDALRVLYRLKQEGFLAYLVGGCVRDILLNKKPKDFDVCTNALPSQIRRIFRNSRLIGKRFRLAHVIFKRNKVIEVSTFRRNPDFLPDSEDRRALTIHSNSYYGTPAEDAWRRDFTINALFYTINNFTIIDYVGGIEDLKNRVIRIIGDPDTRFYEDPVRMMRGIEFAARLGFTIDPCTFEGIKRCKEEIQHSSPARIKEEILPILKCGYGYHCYSLFFETRLFPFIFPCLQPWGENETESLLAILKQMDTALSEGYILSDHLSLAGFLWPYISSKWEHPEIHYLNELDMSLKEIVDPFCHHFHLKIHTRHLIKEIYRIVWRMKNGTGNKGEARLIRKEIFPAAMKLFHWLGNCHFIDPGLVEEWEKRVQEAGIAGKGHRKRSKKKRWRGHRGGEKQVIGDTLPES